MALLLYNKTCADFSCVCTTTDTNFDSFPLVGPDRNPARASSQNLTAQSIRFRGSVATEDQAMRRTVPEQDQAKPSQAKVLTGGGDLREAQVERPPVC